MNATFAGKHTLHAGTSGTLTVPVGASILQIVAHASDPAATLVIFGGDTMPIVEDAPPSRLEFSHLNIMSRTGAADIVFTNTDSYFVEYVQQGVQ
jgi:hypothetical protein